MKKPEWEIRFDEMIGRPVSGEVIKKFIKEELAQQLEDYTDFLLKQGYCDSDVYAEEPRSIDRFLSEKQK